MPSPSLGGCETPPTSAGVAFSGAPILPSIGFPSPDTPRLNEPTSARNRLRYCRLTGSPNTGAVVQREPGGAAAPRSTSQAICLLAGGEVKSLSLLLHSPPL